VAGRTGALLVNLGTPASPRVADVRRYLAEFLADPRVLDMAAPLRWLLLRLVILPFRPRRSAAAYEKVWTPEGSPLLAHGRALADAVAGALGPDWVVELGMRYGEPRIRDALTRLRAAGVSRVVVLPLFPQRSEAATGSAVARVNEELRAVGLEAPVHFVGAFHADRGFVSAVADVARPRLEAFRPDFVLFSYHGLPERQIRRSDPTGETCLLSEACCDALRPANRDCYRAQCFATTRAVAAALGLEPGAFATSFQSRLGRTPWIQPFTDRLLPALPRRGVKRLAVLCPSFVADCLETLEEIGIRARDQWRGVGGEELRLVPAVNAERAWVDAVAGMLRAAR
jgi:ferrochelatase